MKSLLVLRMPDVCVEMGHAALSRCRFLALAGGVVSSAILVACGGSAADTQRAAPTVNVVAMRGGSAVSGVASTVASAATAAAPTVNVAAATVVTADVQRATAEGGVASTATPGSSTTRIATPAPATASSTPRTATATALSKATSTPSITSQPHGELIFSDEFNGTAVDTSKWQVFQRNAQLGGYENTWDASSVTVSGGALHLTAKLVGGVEVSGGMWTQGKQAIAPYGYWEMRARIPATSGTWPAFWAIPYDLPTDASLSIYEIDTMEAIDHVAARGQGISWHVHLRRPDGSDDDRGHSAFGGEMYGDYHTYASRWSPGLIVWYVDDVEWFRVSDPNIPTTRMTAIVQMAMGGTRNPLDRAQLPQTMDVDYIRIYAA